MPDRCKEGKVLMQDGQDRRAICPGVGAMGVAMEEHFVAFKKEVKEAIAEGFQIQLEQATGFAWSERHILKCILGWAKRAKDSDSRTNAIIWGVAGSTASGLIVGITVYFMKGG